MSAMPSETVPLKRFPRAPAVPAGRVPALFLSHEKDAERFLEFFVARIRNRNTRRAYYKAVCRFSE